MSQTIYDRCLILFALAVIILAVLTGCTLDGATAASEPFNEPQISELNFAERPSAADSQTPTINVIFIEAHLSADDNAVNIDGRGLTSPLRQLDHCSTIFFDGQAITIEGSRLPSTASHVVLMDYSGISLSTGGDNTRQKFLTSRDHEYAVPLALDTGYTFYTIDLQNPYQLALWQGEQSGNQLTTSYRRPVAGQRDFATLSETHDITILHNVSVTFTDPVACE